MTRGSTEAMDWVPSHSRELVPGMVVMLYHDCGTNEHPFGLARLIQRQERTQHEGATHGYWIVETLDHVLSGDIALSDEVWFVHETAPPEILFRPDRRFPEQVEQEGPPFEDLRDACIFLYFCGELLIGACEYDAPPETMAAVAATLAGWADGAERIADELLEEEPFPARIGPPDTAATILASTMSVAAMCRDMVAAAGEGKRGWPLFVFADAIRQTTREIAQVYAAANGEDDPLADYPDDDESDGDEGKGGHDDA